MTDEAQGARRDDRDSNRYVENPMGRGGASGCPHQYVTAHGELVVDPKAEADERCKHQRVTVSFTIPLPINPDKSVKPKGR